MALFQPLDLSCPFSTILFRDGRDILTSVDLKVADDQAWTLKEDVHLFDKSISIAEGVLIWCADGTHEVLRISWERARQAIGCDGLIPAGTSLLTLLARL